MTVILAKQMNNYSTLNNDVIPDQELITSVENYQPKFDLEIIERLMRESGMQSSDERVYKLVSVIAEAQLCKIISEVKAVNLQQLKQGETKNHFSFEDLQKAMEEFGIAIRRPPFLEDKAKPKRS